MSTFKQGSRADLFHFDCPCCSSRLSVGVWTPNNLFLAAKIFPKPYELEDEQVWGEMWGEHTNTRRNGKVVAENR